MGIKDTIFGTSTERSNEPATDSTEKVGTHPPDETDEIGGGGETWGDIGFDPSPVLIGGYDVSTSTVDRDRVRVNDEWWRHTGSERLYDSVEMSGLSNSEIADAIGLSVTTLSTNMRGTSRPSAELLDDYATFFGEDTFADAEYDVLLRGCPYHE